MASFFEKGKVEGKERAAAVKHPKDFLEGDNYDAAGFAFFQYVLDGKLTEKNADEFVATVRKYCDTFKVKSKDGAAEYCDLSLYGPFGRRALGAVYGDGNLGGVLYTLAQGFDKIERRERLAKLWGERAGAAPERKGKNKGGTK